MAQQLYRSTYTKPTAKPSRLSSAVAFAIAFLLPFLLTKLFYQQKQVTNPEQIAAIAPSDIFSANTLSSGEDQPLSFTSIREKQPVQTDTSPPLAPKSIKKVTTTKQTIKQTAAVKKQDAWQIIKTRPGDSMAQVFKRAGLRPQTLQIILRDNANVRILSHIKPDQEIRLLVKNNILEKLTLPLNDTQLLVIYREGSHYRNTINSQKMDTQNLFLTATIQGSLYGTAKRYGISYKLISQMTEIFKGEIDFAHELHAGDKISMMYEGLYAKGKRIGTGEILAITCTAHGKTWQAVRHIGKNGEHEYFTPQGTSLKKAFARYPVKFSHISSTFNLSRYHPILHYRRPHKGIDLAAPIGTPVYATGDGYIEFINRHYGYGNMIKIKHNNMYTSLYAHLLRFQKGLFRGAHVKRGQIIGYVGQTGLASGAHCHYEIHLHQVPNNPATVILPRAASVPAREMASFKATTGIMLAQLKHKEESHWAATRKGNQKNPALG